MGKIMIRPQLDDSPADREGVDTSESARPARRMPPGWLNDRAAPDILAEIVHVQREYVRDGDPQRMWDLLLDAVLRTSFSEYGFIGEMVWSDRGIPNLETRAMVWTGEGQRSVHPDIGLLVSQVIAGEEPVIINRESGRNGDDSRFSPVSGFLGLPLVSADRLVAIIGVTSPAVPYDERLGQLLQPLLSTCASIVESLQSESARNRAVKELEATAGFLQTLFSTAAMGVVVIDGSGRISSANPSAQRSLGFPDGTLLGRRVSDIAAPAHSLRVDRLVTRILNRGMRGEVNNVTIRAARLDGSEFTAEVSVSQMRLGDDSSLVVVFQDITERVDAQRSLAKAAEILDTTPDIVCWGSIGGRLEYLNRSGTSMMGAPDEIRSMILGDDLARFHAAVNAAASTGAWSGELRLVDRNGHVIPASVVILHSRSAENPSLALLARDLSDRYEIDQLKDAFVSNVSHELRTPLTSILGYLELLDEGEELTQPQSDLVAVVRRNGDRLLHLIGEILLVASLDRAESDRKTVLFTADELIRDVAASVEVTAVSKGVRLTCEADPSALICADRAEIYSALVNVVGNAIKFTPTGGDVLIRAQGDGVFTTLTVRDNGIGIDPSDIERVRDRFYRGSLARSNEIQGTGLGLAIVDAVTKRAGGVFTIDSMVGVGTTAQLSLPAADRTI